jgi:anti-anti-sigma factor
LLLNISHHGDTTVFDIDKQPRPDDLDNLVKRVTVFCRNGRRKFILNLRGLGRLSSTDIAALVNVNDTCKEHSARLVLCQLQSKINHILEITNLRPFFQVAENFGGAVAQLGGAGVSQLAVERANPVATQEAESRTRELAEKFIRHTVRSRLHLACLQVLESKNLEIISPASLSKAVGVKPDQITEVIKTFIKEKVLHQVGTRAYNYNPGTKQLKQINQFLLLCGSPRYYNQILSMLLKREGEADS